LDWRNSEAMKERKTPHQKIKELERKVKRLEAEKEILNRAIDIADDMLGTHIRKKYLPLLSEASGQQGGKETSN
jgi:transposase